MGPHNSKETIVATGSQPDNSRSEGIHLIELHGGTFTGCFTLAAIIVTGIILWKCYSKGCCSKAGRVCYRREEPQRHNGLCTIATIDSHRKVNQPVHQPANRPPNVPDLDRPTDRDLEEGYYP